MPKQSNKKKSVKTAKVVKNIKEDPCCICFSKKSNEASIDGCSHTFCRKCIVKWSHTENSCPQCRKKFHQVNTKRSSKKIEDRRQRSDQITGSEMDMMRYGWAELLSRYIIKFIISDDFKLHLTSIFVRRTDPIVDRIYRVMNLYLNDESFVEQYLEITPDGLRDSARINIQVARDCMRAVFQREPGGSSSNPISFI